MNKLSAAGEEYECIVIGDESTGPTSGIYHIGVRQKWTTLTVGSAEMMGTNWVLYGISISEEAFQKIREQDIRGASVPNNSHPLPAQNEVMIPPRGMEAHSLEPFQPNTSELRRIRLSQDADRRYQYLGPDVSLHTRLAIFCVNLPQFLIHVPCSRVHVGIEANGRTEIVL